MKEQQKQEQNNSTVAKLERVKKQLKKQEVKIKSMFPTEGEI